MITIKPEDLLIKKGKFKLRYGKKPSSVRFVEGFRVGWMTEIAGNYYGDYIHVNETSLTDKLIKDICEIFEVQANSTEDRIRGLPVRSIRIDGGVINKEKHLALFK